MTRTTAHQCANPTCPQHPLPGSTPRSCPRCRTAHYCSPSCQIYSNPTRQPFPALRTPPNDLPSGRGRNFLLRFTLCPFILTSPPVFRMLSCPADASFYQLHQALQVAFGWTATHYWDFAARYPMPMHLLSEKETAGVYETCYERLAAGLPETDPWIERKLAACGANKRLVDPGFAGREHAVRIVRPEWDGSLGGVAAGAGYERAAPGSIDRKREREYEWLRRKRRLVEMVSDRLPLFLFFEQKKYDGMEFVYTYDLLQNWEHSFCLVGQTDPTDQFYCVDGSGHPVAEDVAGGPMGWDNLKEAYRVQRPTRGQVWLLEWYQSFCRNANKDGLAGDRVNAWDMEQVNRDLAEIPGFDPRFREARLKRDRN